MKRNIIKGSVAILIACNLVACTKKLDLTPTNGVTSTTVYSTPAGYKEAFAKVYAAYALTGNAGPAGDGEDVRDRGGVHCLHALQIQIYARGRAVKRCCSET